MTPKPAGFVFPVFTRPWWCPTQGGGQGVGHEFTITARGSAQRFCTPACRQAAYRRRRAQAPKTHPSNNTADADDDSTPNNQVGPNQTGQPRGQVRLTFPGIVHDRCRGRTNKHELHASTFDNRCGPRADRRVIGRGMGDEEVGPRRSGGHT